MAPGEPKFLIDGMDSQILQTQTIPLNQVNHAHFTVQKKNGAWTVTGLSVQGKQE